MINKDFKTNGKMSTSKRFKSKQAPMKKIAKTFSSKI